jgi:hypothetical protein
LPIVPEHSQAQPQHSPTATSNTHTATQPRSTTTAECIAIADTARLQRPCATTQQSVSHIAAVGSRPQQKHTATTAAACTRAATMENAARMPLAGVAPPSRAGLSGCESATSNAVIRNAKSTGAKASGGGSGGVAGRLLGRKRPRSPAIAASTLPVHPPAKQLCPPSVARKAHIPYVAEVDFWEQPSVLLYLYAHSLLYVHKPCASDPATLEPARALSYFIPHTLPSRRSPSTLTLPSLLWS